MSWRPMTDTSGKHSEYLTAQVHFVPHIVLRRDCVLPAANIYIQFRRHVFLVGCQNITIEPNLVRVP